MQRHQRDLRPLVISVGVADQGRMIQELRQRFAAVARIGRRVDQFTQVFDAGVRLRRIFFFEYLDVSSAIQQKLEQLGSAGGARSGCGFCTGSLRVGFGRSGKFLRIKCNLLCVLRVLRLLLVLHLAGQLFHESSRQHGAHIFNDLTEALECGQRPRR